MERLAGGGGFLGFAPGPAGFLVGGVQAPPVGGGRNRLERAVAFGGLLEQVRQRGDIHLSPPVQRRCRPSLPPSGRARQIVALRRRSRPWAHWSCAGLASATSPQSAPTVGDGAPRERTRVFTGAR